MQIFGSFFWTSKKNNKDKKITHGIQKGKKLQKGEPCDFLKKGAKVKIYKIKENYTQIGFENIIGTTIYDEKDYLKYSKAKSGYTIGKLSKVNPSFDNALVATDILKFVHRQQKNSQGAYIAISEKEETDLIINKGKNYVRYRKVKFVPKHSGKKYWVKSALVTGEVNTWVSLSDAIPAIYHKEPKTDDLEIELKKQVVARKKSKPKTIKDIAWWEVSTKDGQGWIKKEDLAEKNAFNWEDYGWTIEEDTGDQYLYMFGKYVTKSEPHPFIQKIWEIADTDKD